MSRSICICFLLPSIQVRKINIRDFSVQQHKSLSGLFSPCRSCPGSNFAPESFVWDIIANAFCPYFPLFLIFILLCVCVFKHSSVLGSTREWERQNVTFSYTTFFRCWVWLAHRKSDYIMSSDKLFYLFIKFENLNIVAIWIKMLFWLALVSDVLTYGIGKWIL